jgi:hypothetical protein
MDQDTKLPAVKPVKPSQLELDPAPKTREQLIQDTMPHIDPHSAAYQGDLGKVDAIAMAERAKEILDSNDFDWCNDESIVLQEQRATAIYHNRHGDLVIRQRAAWDDEADVFVSVTPGNSNIFLDAVAARIRRED